MIIINKEYGLDRDKYQWILKRKVHSEGDVKTNLKGGADGNYEEDVWVNNSYHRTIPQVADTIINNLDISDCESIVDLLEYYTELTSVLTELIELKVKEEKSCQ